MRLSRELADDGREPRPVIARLDDGALLIDAMSDQPRCRDGRRHRTRRRTRSGRHGDLRGMPRRGRASPTRRRPAQRHPPRRRTVELVGDRRRPAHRQARPTTRSRTEPRRRTAPIICRGRFRARPRGCRDTVVDLAGESLPADVVMVHDAIEPRERPVDQGARRSGVGDRPERPRVTTVAEVVGASIRDLLGRRTAELHRTARACRTDRPDR